ncbi:class I SAM-dependent methyltransferase [Nostoc linckia FACHB-104]|nr:class I SAM-dependent methyltransferase [Nostoc linckia FACHB-104]
MHEMFIKNKLQQANEYANKQHFCEAINLYREILIENPQLAQQGLSIRLAHCLLLSADWLEISKNLIIDTNYLETSGWLNSLSQGKPVNAENRPIPWYTYPAIEFIEDKIKREFLVFEFGGGQSTLWWAERVNQVISVESNQDWYNEIYQQMPHNVHLHLDVDEKNYANLILQYPDKYFDVIIVDGINRNVCLENCLSKLKDNGFIIFDNTDNYRYDSSLQLMFSQGYKRIDFWGLIPGYLYKNCTSIFFQSTEILGANLLPSDKKSFLGKSCLQITNPKATEMNNFQYEDNWQLTTPIALLIFNRPETTAKVFAAIRQAKPTKLLVVADGARADKPGEAETCAATREIINQVDWECEVLTNYSDVNLGCRTRVSSGLNWIFEQVEEAIILEDDCLPHPTFFRYCQELLHKYSDNERIMMISGNNFQFGQKSTEYSYYFSHYGHCWGWASWRRAWRKYDDSMQLWNQLTDNYWLDYVLQNDQAVAYWSEIFQGVYNGLNSWAYIWQYTLWINSGLTILPHVNLVSNIGFDSGTHLNTNDKLANMQVEALMLPLRHPPFIIRNNHADNLTEQTIFSGRSYQFNSISHIYTKQEIINYINENKIDLALKSIKILENSDTSINYVKALALAKEGKIIDALNSLETLLNHHPAHFKGLLLKKELITNNNLDTKLVHPIVEKTIKFLEDKQISEAFKTLNNAKALKQPIMGLDYLRARCFLQINQPAASIQALYEELRYFPENQQADNFLNQLLNQYPQFVSRNIQDAEFQELYKLIQPYTMLSEARLYSLFTIIKRICIENIPGNFVECGVAAGGSLALVAAVIKRYTKQARWVYGFDSFNGMPAPTEQDKSNGIPAEQTGWGTGTCAAPEASVKEICMRLGVGDIVQLVKGYFEETLPKMRDGVGMIALLHMDGDWYESTRTIINNLYDRISNNGFVQVDDYGFWEGCRQALHEFEANHQLKFELHQIDSTGVWFNCPNKFPINTVFDQSLINEFAEDDPVKYGIQSQMSKNERFQLYYALRKLLPVSSETLRFVEIGSFAGSSLFLNHKALAREYHHLQGWAIDPGLHPQLKLVLNNLPPEIIHLKMFSHDALAHLQQIFKQDMNYPSYIFVDGDHSYEGVKQDIVNYYPLLAPGGLIIFHDYLPPLDQQNTSSILFHHGGNEPGIRQACQELMENTYHCEIIEVPLLYPDDPTQTQAHLPIIPRVFSSLRIYRKPQN